MNPVYKYFPNLTNGQREQYDRMLALYTEWNQRINVISRKDMDAFYEHHVLHALAIARFTNFQPGTRIIDVGTGGGFPGMPLAVFFPETEFTLLDSIGKKILVTDTIAKELNLSNVTAIHQRSEQHRGQYDFIVSRAVTTLPDFVRQTRHLLSPKQKNAIGNGILYLKGGDLSKETAPFKKRTTISDLSTWFEEPFFATKKLLHVTF